MFNGFPVFHGNFFSYHQYFALVFCTSSIYTLLLICGFRVASKLATTTTHTTTVFARKNVATPLHLAVPKVAAISILFFLCFMMWLILTLLAFGSSTWTGRALLVFCWYSTLSGCIVWGRQRALHALLPSTDACSNLKNIMHHSILYFDDNCVPVLLSCMLVASSVPVTALGITGFPFGFGCACIAIAPLFQSSCTPRQGCCWRWCFCCKRWDSCQHRGSTLRNSNRSSATIDSNNIDTAFVEMFVKKEDDALDIDDDVEQRKRSTTATTARTTQKKYDDQSQSQMGHNSEDPDGNDAADPLFAAPPSSSSFGSFGRCQQTYHRIPKSILVGQVVAVLFAAVVVSTTTGSCIGFFAPNTIGLHLGPITWTSSFTRQVFGASTSHHCDWNNARFCHMYLTVPSTNASTGLIVTAHTTMSTNNNVNFAICLSFSNASKTCATQRTLHAATSTPVDWVPENPRQVHSAYLGDLVHDETYAVWLVLPTDDVGRVYGEKPDLTFQTLPRTNNNATASSSLRFVVGGDMGLTTEAAAVSVQAAAHNPSFAVIGGDIAYANDIPACVHLWDEWISTYEKTMKTVTNHAIPLIAVVGNHDVGSNSGSGSNAKRFSTQKGGQRMWTTKQIPFIFAFFPHETISLPGLEQKTQVVSMKFRTSFHLHSFDNSLEIFNLDSGHVVPYKDAEQMSLFQQSQQSVDVCKIAVYHVPVFPSGDYSWDAQKSFMVDPREFWLPEFDNIGMHAAFEHHVHTMKETVPLSENSTAATDGHGVTYFGDGRWGITGSDDLTKIKTEIGRDGQQLFQGDIQNHIWFVEMRSANDGGKVLDISAIGTQGKIDGATWDKRIHC